MKFEETDKDYSLEKINSDQSYDLSSSQVSSVDNDQIKSSLDQEEQKEQNNHQIISIIDDLENYDHFEENDQQNAIVNAQEDIQ
jgi:hypothetical protein